MNKPPKFSPLCSRDDDREIYFAAKLNNQKLQGLLPALFLNETYGNNSGKTDLSALINEQKIHVANTNSSNAPLPPKLPDVLIEETY